MYWEEPWNNICRSRPTIVQCCVVCGVFVKDTFRTVPTRDWGGGGVARTNYRGPAVWKEARGPTLLHMFLSWSVVLLSIAQIKPFRPSPYHSATESQSSRFSVNTFSRSALAAGFEKNLVTGARTRSRWRWFQRDEGGDFLASSAVL
jgi:hypothetical protein